MDTLLNNISSTLRRQTNWCIITGRPGSGKTTTVNLLKEGDFITTIKHARHYPVNTQRLRETIEEVTKPGRI